jgi:hypothetical protein
VTIDIEVGRGSAPRWFTAGEPYWAEHPTGPKYGDLILDLRLAGQRANAGERSIDMSDLPAGYRATVAGALITLTQPSHPAFVDAGIILRAAPASPSQVHEAYRTVRMMAVWAESRGLSCFSAWSQNDADALPADMLTGSHRDGGVALKEGSRASMVTRLKGLYDARHVLPDSITFHPWDGRTAASVSGKGHGPENETAPLRWPTWAPLVTASWAFVERFSPDVVRAAEAAQALPKATSGPSARGAVDRLQAWFSGGGLVPLHTGRAAHMVVRGQVNKDLLMKQAKVAGATLNEAARGYNPRAAALIDQHARDPARCQFGGLITPVVRVPQADGCELPWVSEVGLHEARYLFRVLRAACYVVIASLTGMRDSEIAELRRGCVTSNDGLPALRSTQWKSRGSLGEERTWWAPDPVLRACEVMEALSPHPTHLFSKSADAVTRYQSDIEIALLVEFTNARPEERVGRGAPLGLTPVVLEQDDSINATTLRRSFAVFSTTRPGAELGLGIQLGHSAWRLVSGYAADGKQVAVRHLDDKRKELFRASAAELITGDAPLAGPAAKVVNDFRAQVIADPTRAKKVTDRAAEQLHYGLTNDCLWRPDSSACGGDRPKLADHLCAGGSCANALYTPAHERILLDSIARFDEYLDSPAPGSPQLKERMGKDRANIAKVLRELRRATTVGGGA